MGEPLERWTDSARRAYQSERLTAMLREVLATNAFYRAKTAAAGIPPARAFEAWRDLPFTTKGELSADQAAHPPFGTDLTYPLERYVRLHQTSGTTGSPLRVLDTAASWEWWERIWAEHIYPAAGVTSADRVLFCFSFGPFIGFWSAFAGAERLGALCLSGGAQSTSERIAHAFATGATVLLSTPTYALRLAEVARADGVDLAGSALRVSIHAGEPGASIPTTRERIERELGVVAFDHTGATEIGATGFSCEARDGVHLIESEFIVEIRDVVTGEVRQEGEGELVLTNLGRWGMPVLRYRTGDHVVAVRDTCACGRTWVKLRGGIAGRVDDMIIVRGVNVYPSAIESVIRALPEVAEFRLEPHEERGMTELRVVIEPVRSGIDGLAPRVSEAIHRALALRCDVAIVEPGSLPRFDMKAKRVVRGAREDR